MPPIISIVGKSSSGKTTLLRGLIAELKQRGIRVAVVKHSAHEFVLDTPGKDTWLLSQAGSDLVAFRSPQNLTYFRKMEQGATLDEISRLMGEDFDILLTEGFAKEKAPKIEVHRRQQGHDLICSLEELIAVATDEPLDISLPSYALDDFKGLADLIEHRIKAKRGDTAISLFVDGKSIPLGPFAKEIVAKTLLGMISSLKGVTEASSKIDISIRMKETKEVTHG